MKTILVDAVHAFVIKGEGIFKEMHDLLETYSNRKIILTGANDQEYVEFGLANMPYEVFTLKHDPEKTNPLYFEKLLEQFKLNKSDVVYFEHNPEAVTSAQSLGIVTHYYDSTKNDLQALKNFLDMNLS